MRKHALALPFLLALMLLTAGCSGLGIKKNNDNDGDDDNDPVDGGDGTPPVDDGGGDGGSNGADSGDERDGGDGTNPGGDGSSGDSGQNSGTDEDTCPHGANCPAEIRLEGGMNGPFNIPGGEGEGYFWFELGFDDFVYIETEAYSHNPEQYDADPVMTLYTADGDEIDTNDDCHDETLDSCLDVFLEAGVYVIGIAEFEDDPLDELYIHLE